MFVYVTKKKKKTSNQNMKHEGVKYPCDQCDYKATQKQFLLEHEKSKHEGVMFSCDQCEYKQHRSDICQDMKNQNMKVLGIHVINVTIKQQQREIC